MTQYVYDFSQGSAELRSLLGGKGANLAEMTAIGLPVPDGFTVTTEACIAYLDNDGARPAGLAEEIAEHLAALEQRTGKRLGARNDPLLVSVRSGAVVSMPGMMDTILNLGMNDESVLGLAEAGGGERFAYDSYRRFVQMFGNVVSGVDGHLFENALGRIKMARRAAADVDLTGDDLKQVVAEYREIYRHETGEEFPQDPVAQLDRAVEAVFESWNTPRARTYRREYHIADDLGTAVNVVQMVFGNMGDDSATGVCFT
ncbi:MAG: pyruvate, orthophosphate dikinase, partial [Gaiellales bacterium]|nr:pyruvate, orthophosphate dikinase [Gaiellales bacterium]